MAGEVRLHYDSTARGYDDVGARANCGAQQDIEERKPRKSVAFSEGTTVVDENGDVTQQANGAEGSKDTAMSHSSTPATSTSVMTSAPLTALPDPDAPAEEDDDVAAMLAGMKKKKKSKKTEDADGADGDLSMMKKKKKSKKSKDGEDEFAAKLAALDIEKDGEADDAVPEPESEAVEDVGDMEEGTDRKSVV